MSVSVLLPAELAKSRSRAISLLEPATIRRLLGFRTKLIYAIVFAPGFLMLFLFPWPAGAFAIAVDIFLWLRVLAVVRRARSGKVFDVACPNCERKNRHWSSRDFICTDCRHLLKRHADRVYDITSDDVRVLLDSGSVGSNGARVAKKARLFRSS